MILIEVARLTAVWIRVMLSSSELEEFGFDGTKKLDDCRHVSNAWRYSEWCKEKNGERSLVRIYYEAQYEVGTLIHKIFRTLHSRHCHTSFTCLSGFVDRGSDGQLKYILFPQFPEYCIITSTVHNRRKFRYFWWNLLFINRTQMRRKNLSVMVEF